MNNKEAFYNQILNQYKAANAKAEASGEKKPGIPILTSSSLRLETPILNNVTTYTFPILTNELGASGAVFPTEVRLATNDNFHIDKVGIYLAQLVAATDTDFRLKTYPNEVELGAANVNSYFNIYNGTMKLNVNQVDILTNHRVSKHQVIPQTQRLSVAANQNRDQVDLSKDAMIPLSPALMLSGAYTNVLTISLPGAVANAIAGNLTRLIIIFDGLRAQNAAIKK